MPFDNPAFKMLASNDTGGAPGHQGGVLIPKDIETYFPTLSPQVTPEQPTVDAIVNAELFDGSHHLADVQIRYQYQTWGATRFPERRITGNLGELRSRAKKDDILLIERQLSQPKSYRLTLIRQGTSAYKEIVSMAPGQRWGLLSSSVAI